MSDLNFTLIQADLKWEDKNANLKMFEQKIKDIPLAQIVILPEMFSTGFSMQTEKLGEPSDGQTIAWMKKTAAEKKIILTGSIIIEENGKYYNRLVWMLPDGQY